MPINKPFPALAPLSNKTLQLLHDARKITVDGRSAISERNGDKVAAAGPQMLAKLDEVMQDASLPPPRRVWLARYLGDEFLCEVSGRDTHYLDVMQAQGGLSAPMQAKLRSLSAAKPSRDALAKLTEISARAALSDAVHGLRATPYNVEELIAGKDEKRATVAAQSQVLHDRSGAAWPVATASTLGKRRGMEDTFKNGALDQFGTCVAAVFDGHGGKTVAEAAAEQLLPCLDAALSAATADDMHAALRQGLKAGMQDLHDRVAEPEVGSTAVVAHLGPQVHVANVGDSYAILVRHDGTAQRLTEPHKPMGHERVRTRQYAEAAGLEGDARLYGPCWRTPGGIATSRALGDTADAHMRHTAQVSGCNAADGEVLILCTDGMDNMKPQEMADHIHTALASGRPLDTVAQDLVVGALAIGSRDNITVTLIDLRAAE